MLRTYIATLSAISLMLAACTSVETSGTGGAGGESATASTSSATSAAASTSGAGGSGGAGPCDGKPMNALCDGKPGDPIYKVCDDSGACVFPMWTCRLGKPGDACAAGKCTVPMPECNIGVQCVTDSYCCTGCLDDAGHCRSGTDGFLCGVSGEACHTCP